MGYTDDRVIEQPGKRHVKMTQEMTVRFEDSQIDRLGQLARRSGRSISETAAMLVEEALRMSEHGSIVFRDSPVGRQAYVLGTRVAVWQVVPIVRSYGGDVQAAARHLEWPTARIQAALTYAAAYPDEIEAAIEDNARYDFGTVSRMLPQARLFAGE